jgi:hypothetical protein
MNLMFYDDVLSHTQVSDVPESSSIHHAKHQLKIHYTIYARAHQWTHETIANYQK